MAQYMISDETLTDIADAIRKKTKSTNAIQTKDMAEMIDSFQGEGGIDTSDATATADEIFKDETAYVNGEKITGNFTIDNELSSQDDLISQIEIALQNKATGSELVLQEKTVFPTTSAQIITPDTGYDGLSKVNIDGISTTTQATPSISVSSSGLITASATQSEGYVNTGTKSATKQLTTKAATTYTPTTSNQTIASGTYLTGTQTIKGDSNLKAENIASGVSIFGVTGTHSGSEDLNNELTEQENLISQLSTILDNKASGGSGGNLEPYTVSITCNAGASNNMTALYCKSDGSVESTDIFNKSVTLNNVHGLLVIYTYGGIISASGSSISAVYTNDYDVIVYDINCDGTINIQ